jgi:hypothetical protein
LIPSFGVRTRLPALFGSGKLGTPFLRMQAEYARSRRLAESVDAGTDAAGATLAEVDVLCATAATEEVFALPPQPAASRERLATAGSASPIR